MENSNQKYWLEKLDLQTELFRIPTDFNINSDYICDEISCNLSQECKNKLLDVTNEDDIGIYVILLAALKITLLNYTGQSYINVSSPMYRPTQEERYKDQVLILSDSLTNEMTFKEVILMIKDTALGSYNNQNVDIKAIMNVNNTEYIDTFNKILLAFDKIHDIDISDKIINDCRCDIAIEILKHKNFNITFKFNAGKFSKSTIERFTHHYLNILEHGLGNVNSKIKDIEMLTRYEKELLNNLNQTQMNYPNTKTVQQIFEDQVSKHPDNIAVKIGEKAITYKELNNKSNQLANVLISKGVSRNSIVAMMVTRSIDMIIGIISILKAGGAYLPIDPNAPVSRVDYMIKDSKSSILLVNDSIENKLSFEGEIIDLRDEENYKTSIENITNRNSCSDLAYVIYTSGSTGNPKGVMIEHKSLINFIYSMNEKYDCDFSSTSNCLSITNYTFDVSVSEIFIALLFGGKLVIYENLNMFDIQEVSNLIIEEEIEYTYLPPTVIGDILHLLKQSHKEIKLNKLLVGVEPIKTSILNKWIDFKNEIKIVNGYGPTEATICCIMNRYTRDLCEINVPIGKPLGNTKIYILNNLGGLCPVGIPGELYVSGDCLARGYLNNEEMTTERFIKNPFNKNEIMYRTGDLVRIGIDGNVEFMGRSDRQVKIRGYRIELGEIELQILKHKLVKDVVVIDNVDDNKNKYLCAYIVTKKDLTSKDLKKFLSQRLPNYMIPSFFVDIESIPVTRNGKIDRSALPNPKKNKENVQEINLKDEIEEKLVNIWKDLLGVTSVGIEDNFFDLGGHSLLATKLLYKVNDAFKTQMTLSEIFNMPTIKELSMYIKKINKVESVKIPISPQKSHYKTSSAQKRMYAINQSNPKDISYNIPIALEIEGKVNIEAIKEALKKLVNRHEAFRTSFYMEDGEIFQRISKDCKINFTYSEVEFNNIDSLVKSYIKPFSLNQAPLFRVNLIRNHENKYTLLFDIHHIIADGVSLGIIIKEFTEIMEGNELSPLIIQYKDFAEWQQNSYYINKINKEEEYWLSKFQEPIKSLDIPTDFVRPLIKSSHGGTVDAVIDIEKTALIKNLARETDTTMYMILLASFNILLAKYSGQNDIIIGTPIAERTHPELENIVGMFANTLVMRNQIEEESTFTVFLDKIKKNCIDAFNNQNYQFDELVNKLKIHKDFSRNPIFDVMFTMDNMDIQNIEIDGLKINYLEINNNTSKFDLTLSVLEKDNELKLRFRYSKDLFKNSTILKMMDNFKKILEVVTKESRIKIHDIQVLDEDERKKILESNNNNIDKNQINILPVKKEESSVVELQVDSDGNDVEKKLIDIWRELLEVDAIDVTDNFFELGGHSLKGLNLLSQLYKIFNVELTLIDLFEFPTINELASRINSALKVQYEKIEPVPEAEYYNVSSSQKRMFMLNNFDKGSTGYNIYEIFQIEGNIDIKRIERSIVKLIERHESLRTEFKIIDNNIMQKINENFDFKLENIRMIEEDINKSIKAFIKAFDLSKGPLFRVGILEVEQNKSIFVIDMHHIISDGISIRILLKEFRALYNGENLPELSIHYKDFAEWQNKYFKTNEFMKQRQYWLDSFRNEVPVINMPYDFKRPAVFSNEGDRIKFYIDKDLNERIDYFAIQTETTKFMLLLSAYYILLHKYSGQEDIIIGTPIAGRNHPDTSEMVGMFVNTLALRNYPKADKTFSEFLDELKCNILSAFDKSDYPLDQLVSEINANNDISRNLIFDNMFVFQNMDMPEMDFDGFKFQPYNYPNKNVKYDLTIIAEDRDEELILYLEYCTKLFKKDTMHRFIKQFTKILNIVIDNPNIRLSEIDILTDEEKHKLLYEFNNTKKEYNQSKTIHELFEKQVEKTPDNIAVIYNDTTLTYSELNEKANQLARVLISKGVRSDTIVGIMMDKSLEAIVGIIGILKAGGAYLPINPTNPLQRIEYMLKDSNSMILLVKDRLETKINFRGQIISINDKEVQYAAQNNIENTNASEHDLAYIIYTSGTTGEPKGVMVEHESISETLLWRKEKYKFNETHTVLPVVNYAFDGFITSFFTPIISGSKVVLTDESLINLNEIINLINKYKVTHWVSVPTIYSSLLEVLTLENSRSLKVITLAGENTSEEIIKKTKEINSGIEFYNEYGPTENSVITTIKNNVQSDNITVGKPKSNTKIYILDKNLKLQPIGVAGELCISGKGLARGYVNRMKLTSEKFINNPFKSGDKMYKTGDLARWLSNGDIEFLGRVDEQVKIRGFRIEIAEIENQLLKYENIKQVKIVDLEDNYKTKYLCGYIVADRELSSTQLRQYLSLTLPDYMIPTYFVQMEKLPLTQNGKIDRKALPKPNINEIKNIEFEEPRNKIEKILQDIWCDVLSVNNIGINSNFFDLGGDSIKAIRVITKLNQHEYELDIKDLFKYPSIKGISDKIHNSNKRINQDIVEGEFGLCPIQRWFFEKDLKDKHHWNQSVILSSINGFSETILRKIFDRLVEHHDVFRITFKRQRGHIIQINNGIEHQGYELRSFNFTNNKEWNQSIRNECEKLQDSIDLEHGPLVKLGLFKTNDRDYLFITIHHLIIDGVSWRILFEDFNSLYNQIVLNNKIQLPKKTHSYKEWTKFIEEYYNSKQIVGEIDYWNEVENQNVKKLPSDKNSYGEISTVRDSKKLSISLSKNETDKLLKSVNHAYNTDINVILISALAITMKEWSGNNKVLINLEGHGRETLSDQIDISRTIGWFTSQYPVVIDILNTKNISYIIKNTKEILKKVPNKGVGYGILRYIGNGKLTPKLQPEISFNYLGQFENEINNDIFKLSDLQIGSAMSLNSQLIYSISINAVISKEKLDINITYDTKRYSKETINKILRQYKYHLCQIIEHCVNKNETELTPSDFDSKDITIKELEEFTNDIENLLGN